MFVSQWPVTRKLFFVEGNGVNFRARSLITHIYGYRWPCSAQSQSVNIHVSPNDPQFENDCSKAKEWIWDAETLTGVCCILELSMSRGNSVQVHLKIGMEKQVYCVSFLWLSLVLLPNQGPRTSYRRPRSTVVTASARPGAGGRGSIPDRVTPKT